MNTESKVRCIKAIDRATVHKICSGQVVLSLANAVKELVENSIDAGASIIDVRLKQYGKELVEVVDNGHGVKDTDFESLTLKHHTSKIEDFSDLTTVQTFGFRGEALSSLCALCDVEIVTRHSESDVGTRLIFDNNGNILQKLITPRQVGTTVNLKNLFVTLPVRHKEFHKNLNKEFSKMVNVLNAYCIITQNKRITCTNTTDKGRQTTILSTNCSSSIKDNLMCVFGNKQVCSLLKFEQVPPSEAVLEEFSLSPSQAEKSAIFQLEGYISTSTHGRGRSTADRQFFFIDGRPCDLPKVSKIMNNVYHSFNRHQYPFICINIILKEGSADVNVTPDKRLIFLPQEKILMATIKTSLLHVYNGQPSEEIFSSSLKNHFTTQNKVTAVSSVGDETKEKEGLLLNLKRSLSSDNINQSPQPLKNRKMSEGQLPTSNDANPCDNSKKEDSLLVPIKNSLYNGHTSSPNANLSAIPTPFLKNKCLSKRSVNVSAIVPFKEATLINKLKPTLNSRSSVLSNMLKHARWKASVKLSHDGPSCESDIDTSATDQIENGRDVDPAFEDCVDGDVSGISERECVSFDGKISSFRKEPIDDFSEDVVCSESFDEPSARKRKYVKCPFMMEVLQRRLKTRERNKATNKINYLKFRSKISPNENQQAEEELKKEISKDSFPQMEILGQFNLGFIITKLHSDLFIVDQHATDEKYNFEVLQRDYVLETQKLIVPLPLELTVSSEAVLIDNLHVFEKNGFKFNINDGTQLGDRIQLVSVPVSNKWTFGKDDVDEIIFMLTDNPVTMVRPSRVIQMFASRACRKSVMIGTALSVQIMKKLITHMGEMEQPWNCPHGRPTMRHLFNLNLLQPE